VCFGLRTVAVTREAIVEDVTGALVDGEPMSDEEKVRVNLSAARPCWSGETSAAESDSDSDASFVDVDDFAGASGVRGGACCCGARGGGWRPSHSVARVRAAVLTGCVVVRRLTLSQRGLAGTRAGVQLAVVPGAGAAVAPVLPAMHVMQAYCVGSFAGREPASPVSGACAALCTLHAARVRGGAAAGRARHASVHESACGGTGRAVPRRGACAAFLHVLSSPPCLRFLAHLPR
jgi:hypothetical protein